MGWRKKRKKQNGSEEGSGGGGGGGQSHAVQRRSGADDDDAEATLWTQPSSRLSLFDERKNLKLLGLLHVHGGGMGAAHKAVRAPFLATSTFRRTVFRSTLFDRSPHPRAFPGVKEDVPVFGPSSVHKRLDVP